MIRGKLLLLSVIALIEIGSIDSIRPLVTRLPASSNFESNFSEPTISSSQAPIFGAQISSGYGFRADPIDRESRFHKGVDFAVAEGSPIFSVGFGEVAFAGEYAGYGNLVLINHGNDLVSLYGHCSEILVRVGDSVSPGSLIARVGHTGRATGPHLHFEMRLAGQPVKPPAL